MTKINKEFDEKRELFHNDIVFGDCSLIKTFIIKKLQEQEAKHKKKIEEMIEEEKRIAKGIKEIKQQVEEIVNKVK